MFRPLLARTGLTAWLALTSAQGMAQSREVEAVDNEEAKAIGTSDEDQARVNTRNARDIRLSLGEQTIVPAKGVRSYSEGTPGVADIRLPEEGDRFVILGRRVGTTTLLLIMESGDQVQYRIRVRDPSEDRPHVPERENIRLDFYFVELSESYNHDLGLDWPSTVDGGSLQGTLDLTTGTLQGATISVANQVLPKLDIGQSSGWAKILRHAAMITTNGREVSFSSGGEVNVAINNALAAEIRRIPFGSDVKVLPRHDPESARIELSVSADVSDLADDNGTGVPGRSISRLDTVVNLEIGQSLVLAGLDSSSRQATKSGLPWLSQIPILGALFGTDQRQSQDRKNLLIIVPTALRSIRGRGRERIDEALRLFDDFDGNIEEFELVKGATQ